MTFEILCSFSLFFSSIFSRTIRKKRKENQELYIHTTIISCNNNQNYKTNTKKWKKTKWKVQTFRKETDLNTPIQENERGKESLSNMREKKQKGVPEEGISLTHLRNVGSDILISIANRSQGLKWWNTSKSRGVGSGLGRWMGLRERMSLREWSLERAWSTQLSQELASISIFKNLKWGWGLCIRSETLG